MSEDGLSTLDVPIHIVQDHIPKLSTINQGVINVGKN